jgi:hypothetical protein
MSNASTKRDLKAALVFIAAAVSLLPIGLSVFFVEPLFRGPLEGAGNLIFFLPQYAFPYELTGEHGRVPGIFSITVAVWLLVAAMFAVATRRLRFRWVVLLALPVVVLCTWAFTIILGNFGYAAVLDGP